MWAKNEIENYFCSEAALTAYVAREKPNDLFAKAEQNRRKRAMTEAIDEVARAVRTLKGLDIWSDDVKASDDVLDPIFRAFSEKLGIPLALRKSQFHELVPCMDPGDVAPEVVEKLDMLCSVADSATPAAESR